MESPSATSILFSMSPIEARDELDERLDRSLATLLSTISSSASESEIHDALNTFVSRSPLAHEEVCIGLLVNILSDSKKSEQNLERLCLVNRDGMSIVMSTLIQIILEKFWKLQDSSRMQILWLVRKFVNIRNMNGVEGVVFNLLRNVAGGDISTRNISFADTMVNLLVDIRDWIEKTNYMTATVVYTLLRLIVDHSAFPPLRQKEVNLAISLLRERFSDCIVIGRDLVRLLQNVARIPEFEIFWKDLLNNPMSLSPNFTGILQLLQTRTSRRFLQCRLTPDMERKIVFLTSQVKFGQQKRYQDWFQRQYLSTPESQSLRCDLIRFICGVIHPSNEVLCSDIIPRWAVIGWILSSCTSSVAASNAKLSLFYDWLFYDAEKDNIMNIEPAILVMYHSMRSHPVITVTLLDFLCRIVHNFCPSLTSHVRRGICTSLQQILEKRVLPSLTPLFEGPKLDPELRALIKQTFPEFCSSHCPPTPEAITIRSTEPRIENNDSNHSHDTGDARFSDDEDDSIPNKTKGTTLNNGQVTSKSIRKRDDPPSRADLDMHLDQFCDEVKKELLALIEEKDAEVRCQMMEKVLDSLSNETDFDQEMSSSMAVILSYALHEDLTKKVFPTHPDEESLEDSIGSPFFVIVRTLCETPEEDPGRAPILSILSDLSNHISCVGYCILYYIKVSKASDISAYKEFAKLVSKDLSTCLLNDLRTCQEDDVGMFSFILPDTYRNFESTLLSTPLFLHLTVSCIDAIQLQDLVCHILCGDMKMLKKENIVQLINASLEWETFEQNCLWQLIFAHNVNVESILPVLPKLEYPQHSEALTAILLSLRKQEPTVDLLKHILSREVKEDDSFAPSILILWCRSHEKKMAELISSYLAKHSTSPAKRKRQNSAKVSLSSAAELGLAHLNQLRQDGRVSPSFFNHETMQSALVTIQTSCTDTQKTRFSDLFALAEEADVKPKKKTAAKKKSNKTANGSSDSEVSDEGDASSSKTSSKQTTQRKKRKAATNNSDSD